MYSKNTIEVANISKCYEIYEKPHHRLLQIMLRNKRQYYREFWALNDINFSVAPGETVGIVGRNGSGKSTLLQIICGTLRSTSGSVQTNGRIAALLELGAGFNPDFTGRENAFLNAQILGLETAEIHERMHDIETFADIGDFFDRPVKTYSSGMYVRVAFAVQACITPDILVVDEALAVGDEKFQRKCYERFEQLRDKGTSILFVTHSTTAIERFCQKAVLLHKGTMHGIGPSNEIVDQYHALLYSDEKTYLKHINSMAQNSIEPTLQKTNNNEISLENDDSDQSNNSHAWITSIKVLDDKDGIIDCVAPQEKISIEIEFFAENNIESLQVGISFKTVEGVHAYGTSTLYTDKNIKKIIKGQTITVRFSFELNLSAGTYYLSAAIAKPVTNVSMEYVDKRSDYLILKVSEPRMKCSGIAYMQPDIVESRT